MRALDWVFMGILSASTLLGLWRGLLTEVLSWASWLAAFLLAQWFAAWAGAALPLGGSGETLRYAVGFVAVFVATLVMGGVVTFLLSELLAVVGFKPLDRLLGGFFGLLRGVVLLLAVTTVVNMTPLREAGFWREARGARWSESTLSFLKPLLPQSVGKYLPSL